MNSEKYQVTSEKIEHFQIDTDAAGNQIVTDLQTNKSWGGMQISTQNNASDVVENMLEEEAMKREWPNGVK